MRAVRMKSRFLKLKPSGARIQVIEAGPDGKKKGRDLLFLHGAGGHMPNDPLIAALASKYRVVAPLLPGYGESSGEDGLRDMLDITLHALDVLEALGLEKPIVVGHSMGGMIAAEMAAVARTEISRLCLLAPAGLWLEFGRVEVCRVEADGRSVGARHGRLLRHRGGIRAATRRAGNAPDPDGPPHRPDGAARRGTPLETRDAM